MDLSRSPWGAQEVWDYMAVDSTQEPGYPHPNLASLQIWDRYSSGAGILLEQEVGSPLYHCSGLEPPPRELTPPFL